MLTEAAIQPATTQFWSRDRLPAPFRMRFTKRSGALPSESQNLALHVGDDPRRVRENRRTVFQACNLNDDACVIPQQVHGSVCVRVDEDDRGRGAISHKDSLSGADALVTSVRGLPLMCFSADCLLVVLGDPQARVLGLAHAGWRGLADGVLENTIECMREAGANPQRIHAASGPSIGPCCFEVGDDVVHAFGAQYVSKNSLGATTVDLREAARDRLLNAGVASQRIGIETACTSCREADFFSHRRATRQGLKTTGRMAMIAWME